MDSYNTKKQDFYFKKHQKTNAALLSLVASSTEEEKKTPELQILSVIADFDKAQTLKQFKDTYKRMRKIFKDHQTYLTQDKCRAYVLDIILALARDAFFSDIKDIKGLINDLLMTLMKEGIFFKEIAEHINICWKEAAEERLQDYEAEIKKLAIQGWEMPLDKNTEQIKILNHFADVVTPQVAAECDGILNLLLKCEVAQLHILLNTLEKSRFSSIKFVYLMSETLRFSINIVTCFKENIIAHLKANDEVTKKNIELISIASKIVLFFITRLSHDSISQCSMMAIFIDFNIFQNDHEKREKDYFGDSQITSPFTGLTHNLNEDSMKLKRLSVIRGLTIHSQKFNFLTENKWLGESPYDHVTKLCDEPNASIKNYAFKTMAILLPAVRDNDKLRTEFLSSQKHLELFDLLLKNWEFPLKGVAHQIEELFINMIEILIHEDKSHKNKYLIELRDKILDLNIIHTKRKYCSLILLLDHIDVDDLLNAAKVYRLIFCNPKDLIYQLLVASGETYYASAFYLFEKIMIIINKKLEANIQLSDKQRFLTWSNYWVNDLIKCLANEDFRVINGVMNHINPIVCKINRASCGFLIELIMKQDLTKKNYLWCYVSLLKSARDNYLIEYDSTHSKYIFKNEVSEINKDLEIDLAFLKVIRITVIQIIKQAFISSERSIVFTLLEFITVSPKDSHIPAQFEYDMVIQFLKYSRIKSL